MNGRTPPQTLEELLQRSRHVCQQQDASALAEECRPGFAERVLRARDATAQEETPQTFLRLFERTAWSALGLTALCCATLFWLQQNDGHEPLADVASPWLDMPQNLDLWEDF